MARGKQTKETVVGYGDLRTGGDRQQIGSAGNNSGRSGIHNSRPAAGSAAVYASGQAGMGDIPIGRYLDSRRRASGAIDGHWGVDDPTPIGHGSGDPMYLRDKDMVQSPRDGAS